MTQPLTLAQVATRTLTAIVVVALLALSWRLVGFLATPIVLGLLISYCLGPFVNRLEDRGLPRWASVLVCFAAVFAALASVAAFAWPSVHEWLREPPSQDEGLLAARLAERMQGWETELTQAFPRLDWTNAFARARVALMAQRTELMETVPTLVLHALTGAGTFVLAPVIALFLLLDGAAMQKAVIALVPNRYFETVLVLLHRVDRQIAGYLRGAASESALVFALMSSVLWLAGMPKAFVFGAIYGMCNVIPMVGPMIGAACGLLYSFADPAAPSAGVLLASYGVVYALDAMFINPLVVGKSLNLHPLTIIVGISIGGHAAGILGMLVSIPVIAVGKAIVVTVLDYLRARRAAA